MRINQSHIYAKFHTFVDQELAQLIERPRVTASTFYLGVRQFIGALSDSGQVLQGNRLICDFCLLDQPITDGVVKSGLESSFTSTQLLQDLSRSTTSRPCTFGRFLGIEPLKEASHSSRCSHSSVERGTPAVLVENGYFFSAQPSST